jgi:hypothetical protein
MLVQIEDVVLAYVTGGRHSQNNQTDPALLQMMQQLSDSIKSVGQNLAQEKAGENQNMMQMAQQVMQMRMYQ